MRPLLTQPYPGGVDVAGAKLQRRAGSERAPRGEVEISTAELRWRDRVRGHAARLVSSLPDSVQIALSRRARVRIDGQTLDPTLQLFASLRHLGERPMLRDSTPAQARARHRREVLSLQSDTPTQVAETRELLIDGAEGPLRARHYTPAASRSARIPLLVYYHGGGFTVGELDTVDETCRLLCRFGEQQVLSVEYRLAPEHPFPAAPDDAEAAFRWAQARAAIFGVRPEHVAVGGDSAGGNLAAVVAQRAALHHPPVAQLLIYPPADRSTHWRSADLFDEFFLSVSDRDAFSDWYYRATGTADDHPEISPLCASGFAALPPTMVVTAGFDILRDEAEAYARALDDAGVRCVLHRERSLAHGFVQLTGASRACYSATVSLARRWHAFLDPLLEAGS